MTAATLPDASHIVVTMCDGMDLNIVTRDDRVVLPRVEVVLEDSDDENDGEDDMTPEEVAAAKAKFEALVKGTDGDEDDAEWVDEDEDDDAPPPPPRLESEIEAEHAPALYGSTKVVDIEDLAFPASLLGVGALLENVETLRIKAVPSSGFLGDWPVSFKNVTVWHNEMNYEYGPFMDEDDSDLDSDEEDEEDEEKAEDKTEGSAEKEKVKVSADADADDENDVSYVPDEDDSDDEEETILCTSRFVLNITPSHATTPKVTKALEDLINYLNAPLDEITIVFNVDKAYKQPKDYEPGDDFEEPPLLAFLLTLLTMCAGDDTKITLVDFDSTGVEWLGEKGAIPTGIDATGIVPPEVAHKVFEEFINGGLEEVRDAAKEDGLGDVGTKRTIKYLSRDEYKAAIGDAQFKLDTQWEK